MKNARDISYNWGNKEAYPDIPHVIEIEDFNTEYPNPTRIKRISQEIDSYLKRKHKDVEVLR